MCENSQNETQSTELQSVIGNGYIYRRTLKIKKNEKKICR